MPWTAEQADVDEQGHISNVAYVRWIQEVAMAHSSARGFEPDAYRALGAVFVVRRHEVDYLRPAYAGDELELSTRVLWWRAAQCERETRIIRLRDQALIAQGRTVWVYVSTTSGKPRRIPKELEAAFYAT